MSKNTCCPPAKNESPCCPPQKEVSASSCPPQKEEPENCCPPPKAEQACCPPGSSPDACCPPESDSDACCPGVQDDRPGYKLWPFVCGWLQSPAGQVPQIASRLTSTDIYGRWQMRWSLGRSRYSIAPGLYAIGSPSDDSPVLVTANYKMTFDIVRNDMHTYDAWLLVLDTKGVNVWCAAGKGTFGTDELINQVKRTKLQQVVNHSTLILPQLGAPGVSAHKVKQACDFKVIYGPVRSSDLPRFLENGQKATPEMRRVEFTLLDRLILTPVELVNMKRYILWSILVLCILGGIGPQVFTFSAAWSRVITAIAAGLLGLFTGAVLTPVLLPWLPGRTFAMRGAVAGLATSFIAVLIFSASLNLLNSLALLLAVIAVSSWCAMHFTGSSTFTSPSGVEKEMRQAIPAQAAALLVGGLCWIASVF